MTTSFVRERILRWLPASVQGVGIAALALALPAFSAATASVFSITNVPLPGVGNGSVVCGDFNNDGRIDVLLTGVDGSFTGICQLWQNGSNGVFTNLNVKFPGLSSSAAAQGDLDGDGNADLLLTGYAGLDGNHAPIYVSQVWRGLGDGTFTNIQADLPGVDTGAVALGDCDDDGNLDILLTGYSSTGATAQIWRNPGNGTFTNRNAGLPGVFYSSAAWGDYDHDGLPDILLTGTSNGFINTAVAQLWRNRGNGTFARISTDLPGVLQGAAAWGDFDQDGWLDILLTGYSNTGALCQVWQNLGDGSFTNMNAGLPGVYQSSVALGDCDSDGKLDVVLAGVDKDSNPICQVWRNTGNWVFTNMNAGLPGIHYGSVVWADFDTDGRLDLLLAGLDVGHNPILHVYHNNTASRNTSAPRINRLRTLGDSGHQLSFNGEIGFHYRVWASTDLLQWVALGVPNAGSPETFHFTDRSAPELRCRFYRLSMP